MICYKKSSVLSVSVGQAERRDLVFRCPNIYFESRTVLSLSQRDHSHFDCGALFIYFDHAVRPVLFPFRLFLERASGPGLMLIGLVLGLGLTTEKAHSQQSVEVTWDPDQSGLVTGYRLFYGTKSGIYTNSIVFSDVNDVEVDGLQGRVTYYFAVQSTDQQGDISPLSNEASYSVAILQPVNLQLVQTFPGSKSLYIAWQRESTRIHGIFILPRIIKNWNAA